MAGTRPAMTGFGVGSVTPAREVRAAAAWPRRSSPACPATTAPPTNPSDFRSRPSHRRDRRAPAGSAICGTGATARTVEPRVAGLTSISPLGVFHPRRDGGPSGACIFPRPLAARVRARRKARSKYGGTSIAGRAGAFRRAWKRRSCNAGPRFLSAKPGLRVYQPAPGRDS